MPERFPKLETPSPAIGEVLKDPVEAFLKRYPVDVKGLKSLALDDVTPGHRAEMMGEAYEELKADLKDKKAGRPVEEKLAFVAALHADPETRNIFRDYWQKVKAERRAVNGTYEEYRDLKKDIDRLEDEYDKMSHTLFSHRGERASAVDKHLYQTVRGRLDQKREELKKHLDTFPKLAARVSYDRLAEYNQELSKDNFMWFPSRRAILEQLEESSLTGRPVLFLGESGTGKTSLVTAAAKNLTGELPFKAQGGPSTRLQDSLATKGLRGDVSVLEFRELGQAITGKETNLDETPRHQGGVYFDDEFNNRPKAVQTEIVKAVSGIRPGHEARLPLVGKVQVQPNYLFVAAGNPPGERYDREPPDPAVKREFGAVIQVDYPEQSRDNPEVYEGMLAALMDKSGRIRFAKSELEPAWDQGPVLPGGKRERAPSKDPKAGGYVWRFGNALNELYQSFSHRETALKSKGEAQYLSEFVLDPGVAFGWFRSAVEQGYQGSLEDHLNEKLAAKLSEAGIPKEDAKLAREFCEHFGLLKPRDKKKKAVAPAFAPMTPEDMGLLSPRVKYLKTGEVGEILDATVVVKGKPLKYRKEGIPEASVGAVRKDSASVSWTLIGTTKDGQLVIHSDEVKKSKDRLVASDEFLGWEGAAPPVPESALSPEQAASILERNRAWQKEFFGRQFDMPPLPPAVTPERLKHWESLKYELRFLPRLTLDEAAAYPGWKKKPGKRHTPSQLAGIEFFDELRNIQDLPENANNSHLAGLAPNELPGAWALMDTRAKPNYADGKQQYEDDKAMQELLKRLTTMNDASGQPLVNKEAKGGLRNSIHPSIFQKPEFWKELQKFLQLEDAVDATVRLPRVIEQNVSGQAPNWDGTSTYEWAEEYYRSGRRLVSGYSGSGGASIVRWRDDPDDIVGFRPLVVFPPRRQ